METKFTPGPWARKHGSLYGADGKILLVSGANVSTAMSYKTEVSEANGNLLFAAPDLYESLEAMCDLFLRALNGKVIRNADEFYSTAQAALAKARGEK